MQISWPDGQPRVRQILQGHLAQDRISHAYIFEGAPGTGKRAAAEAFAAAMLCESGGLEACGVCVECRRLAHGNHPDYHPVEPQGASVKIDQIRELQRQFAYRSSNAKRKIYLIDPAEAMTEQAANSLLKFLEEPGAGVTALLITANRGTLLATVRSRAQTVSFPPLQPQRMLEELLREGHPELLARTAVCLASGTDGARKIIQSEWFAEIRSLGVQLAKECHNKSAAAMLTAGEKLFRTDLGGHLDVLLDLLVLWFKDMIYMQYGRKDKLVFADQSEWLGKHAFDRSMADLTDGMNKAAEARKRLRSHANPQLVLEQLLAAVERR